MRKKKPTVKFKPRNQFRYNNSPLALGHPHFVFGETKTKYKSLSLTTHPTQKHKHVKLTKNPEPNNPSDSYLQVRVHTANKKYYSNKRLKGWSFAADDLPIVRHLIKKYKKAAYRRKPPNYYEDKKRKK